MSCGMVSSSPKRTADRRREPRKKAVDTELGVSVPSDLSWPRRRFFALVSSLQICYLTAERDVLCDATIGLVTLLGNTYPDSLRH